MLTTAQFVISLCVLMHALIRSYFLNNTSSSIRWNIHEVVDDQWESERKVIQISK